jgi:hypothetical protein
MKVQSKFVIVSSHIRSQLRAGLGSNLNVAGRNVTWNSNDDGPRRPISPRDEALFDSSLVRPFQAQANPINLVDSRSSEEIIQDVIECQALRVK